ncbi:MAG TPA: HNH endonuclease family protein [Mycobacteriales bacterium]|nr:HNH endonuclease family protein [Mycobacteriales bacterium]
MRRSNRIVLGVLVGLGVAACAALQSGAVGGPTDSGGPPVAVRPADSVTARAELAKLTVAAPRTGGYERTKDFGPAWSYDFDHNGCRQRDDVLRRDLTKVKLSGKCTVVAGVLADPYTGRTIVFTKAKAAAVQIDHIYPLSAAWSHGARSWTPTQRLHLANDPGNLLAVDGPTNASKGDSTPSEWQPRSAYRCTYAIKYVDVASRYHLTISVADKTALGSMLGTCPKPKPK